MSAQARLGDEPRHALTDPHACRNCRRPIEYVPGIGWLHGELPQYAHEDITCTIPVCVDGPHSDPTVDDPGEYQ